MPLIKLGELSVPSDQARLAEVDQFAEKLIKQTCFPADSLDDIAISISEAVNNAMLHGNKLNDRKSVLLRLYICSEYLRITVDDEGGGFTLSAVPDPTDEKNLLKASGRGLLIMRHLMDRVKFKPTRKGMQVSMEKDCPKG